MRAVVRVGVCGNENEYHAGAGTFSPPFACLSPQSFPCLYWSFPHLPPCHSRPGLYPVIPAKAGIQRVLAKPATRNQARTAASGSLLPSWEKVRMRVSRASSPRPAAAKPATRNQARTAASGSLLPLWEKARMRVSRASSPRPEAAKLATRNQVQIAASGSLLNSWEKARMRVSRASSPRPEAAKLAAPKSSTNSSQRIPSQFMGEG